MHAEGAASIIFLMRLVSAGFSPATHDVCGRAPAQIQECISNHLAAEGEHCFLILIIATTLT